MTSWPRLMTLKKEKNMIKNSYEKEIWPIIFKELSDKQISYAVCKNTHPQKQEWDEYHYHKLPIMLEDPNRPPLPGSGVPWSCFLTLEISHENLSIDIDLDIYLPVSVDIKSVLSILEHPYIGDHPSLIIEKFPNAGKHYCIHIDGSHINSTLLPTAGSKVWLQTRIKAVDDIVKVLYKIENDPKNKTLIDDLIDHLVEI